MDSVCFAFAQAAFESLPKGDLPLAEEAGEELLSALSKDDSFALFLGSPNIGFSSKERAIDETLSFLPQRLQIAIKLLAKKGYGGKLSLFLQALLSLVRGKLGVKEGIAYSARPLDPESLSRLEAAVGGRIGYKAKLKNIVDSRLLGGAKVAIDGKTFDYTLARQLESLRAKLEGGIAK